MAPPTTAISIPNTEPLQDDYDKRGDVGRRSRSPADRGTRVYAHSLVMHYYVLTLPYSRDDGNTNPGNNLHVSGLSRTVEARDLEDAFAKVGRVSAQYQSLRFVNHL